MTAVMIIALVVFASSVSVLFQAIRQLERSHDVLNFVVDLLEHKNDRDRAS